MRGLIFLILVFVVGSLVAPDATGAIFTTAGDALTEAWPHLLTMASELLAALGRFITEAIRVAQGA